LTTESDEKDRTAPLELPATAFPPALAVPIETSATASAPATSAEPRSVDKLDTDRAGAPRPAPVARAASPAQQDVLFVPLAVSIGDGFKFGCGFFLAMVLALLVGFVLVAVLFVVTSLFGLNLPISR
jgi:hypothetical protein